METASKQRIENIAKALVRLLELFGILLPPCQK
jgi:hypothetical protein